MVRKPNPTNESAGLSSTSPWVVSYERLRHGDFYADFRRDTRIFPEIYHCVVQRDGSGEILSWTQHPTLEESMESAKGTLEAHALRSGEAQKAVGES